MAKTVRWVQYEAAVFVRVEADENGDTEITKVVTATDAGELQLATTSTRRASTGTSATVRS